MTGFKIDFDRAVKNVWTGVPYSQNDSGVVLKNRVPYIESNVATIMTPEHGNTTSFSLFQLSNDPQLRRAGHVAYSEGARYSYQQELALSKQIGDFGPGGLARAEKINLQYAAYLNDVFRQNASVHDSTSMVRYFRQDFDNALGQAYEYLVETRPELDSESINNQLEMNQLSTPYLWPVTQEGPQFTPQRKYSRINFKLPVLRYRLRL